MPIIVLSREPERTLEGFRVQMQHDKMPISVMIPVAVINKVDHKERQFLHRLWSHMDIFREAVERRVKAEKIDDDGSITLTPADLYDTDFDGETAYPAR